MKKIATLAAVLFFGAVVAGPAALAQATGEQNSGAGMPAMPGNKSSPAGNPGMMGMMGRDGYAHDGWHQGRGAIGMRMVFSLMDANGDGKLTLEEWEAAQERIFKAMDADHDGTVTFEEMEAFIHGTNKPAPSR